MRIMHGICNIDEIDSISVPYHNHIRFREDTGTEFTILIKDVMRMNAIIEKHIPEGMSKEEYFEKLPKEQKV